MTRQRFPRRIARAVALAMAAAWWCATAAAQTTSTTTTTYAYNADGALTAVTTQIDAQPATTEYLTWDNFVPAAGDPASGTVRAGTGNLLGIGATPGGAFSAAFGYDTRDRLISCDSGDASASYAYDAGSLLASSALASGDALQFHYDASALPWMTNTAQASTGLTASFLGGVRYLSDGTEQALLTPRKDTLATYEPASGALTPYGYEPYGAPLASAAASTTTADGYDLADNPFQYGGEYRDPTCAAYYLRTRWYLPAQQTFLTRDPVEPLHRYGYTAGDPIGRVDPSGMRFTGADFTRDIDKAVRRLTPGAWAYVEPIIPFWGDALGGIQMLGLLPSFWHHPTVRKGVEFGFLSASIVAEVGGETRAFDERFASPGRAFGARIGIDMVLGASQTAAQSVHGRRVDVPALVEGIETTAAGILWGRGVAGIGYRPYNLTADDVQLAALNHLGAHDDLLIFRARIGIFNSGGRELAFVHTSPLLEQLHLGMYHERLIAFGRDAILRTDLTVDEDGFARIATSELKDLPADYEYRYAGRIRQPSEADIRTFQSSPLGVPMRARAGSVVSLDAQAEELDRERYSMWRRNCQMHAAAVRRELGL